MSQHPLWQALGRHWKWIALRGVAALLFGILAMVWPGIVLTVMVLFFGAAGGSAGAPNIIVLLPGFCGAGAGGGAAVGAFAVKTCAQRVH